MLFSLLVSVLFVICLAFVAVVNFFFFFYRLYTGGRGGHQSLLSFLYPFAMKKNCSRNSGESVIGFIRKKRDTVQH